MTVPPLTAAPEATGAGPLSPRPGPSGRRSLRATVQVHLSDPMRRSSYALIVGTGLTSALGLLFWALAARWLPESTVGIGAALVSAITLLANFSTLGLRNGLVRFLPAAGAGGRRLIAGSYAVCVAAAVLLASIFLIGQPLWAQKLGFLRESPQTMAVFVSAVAIWVIFILQDHVLLATRRSGWVPVANGICSIAKIILLPVLAAGAVWAIFTATVLPAAVAVLAITVLVLRRPRNVPVAGEPLALGRLARFAATDHLSALLWLGTTDILTLVILQAMGPEASAYYFIATTIGYSLYLITSNVGSALVAEGARYPERVTLLARQSALNAARLVVPLAAAGSLLAPVVLGIMGPAYAANGTLLLQLVLASAVPQIIVSVAMSSARLRHELRLIMIIYGAQSVGMLGGSYLLIGPWGLAGVGFACLATATVVAAALLVTGRTGLLSGDQERLGPLGRLGALAAAAVGGLRRRRAQAELERRRTAVTAALGLPDRTPGALLTSDGDTLIWAPETNGSPVLVKIATSAAAAAGLESHAATVDRFGDDRWPASWRRIVPTVVGRTTVDGLPVLLESRLPGEPADRRAADPAVTLAALTTITGLHAATAAVRLVDPALFEDWVGRPLRRLRQDRGAGEQQALDAIEATLRAALAGREVRTAATHGDFWPGNVLFAAETPELTGIVDWENARRVGLPDLDLLHWWLAAQPGELGATVCAVLADPAGAETRLAELPLRLVNPEIGIGPLVTLTWLGHVADGLGRASRSPLSRVWWRRNVRPVLRHVAGGSR